LFPSRLSFCDEKYSILFALPNAADSTSTAADLSSLQLQFGFAARQWRAAGRKVCFDVAYEKVCFRPKVGSLCSGN
jgi:hypothetical protein